MRDQHNQSINPKHEPVLDILEKLDALVKSTQNSSQLIEGAEKFGVISRLEKDTIVSSTRFVNINTYEYMYKVKKKVFLCYPISYHY